MGCSSNVIPYGSIVGSIFLYCGIGLFCGSSLTALAITQVMLTDAIPDADVVIFPMQITIYTLTPFMVLVGVIYCLFGYAATKQSKVQVYDDHRVTCGGLGCVSVTLYVAYLLLIVWLAIGGASTLPVVFTYMVSNFNSTTSCLDLRLYGFVNQNDSASICDQENIKTFVALAGDAFLMYALQLGGCVLVIIGMIHLMMCLSANWAHLKDGLKRRDYESRRREEEAELQEMGPASSLHRGPRAKVYDTSMGMGQQSAYNPNLPPIGGFGEIQQHPQPHPLHHPHHQRYPSQPTVSTERLVNDYY